MNRNLVAAAATSAIVAVLSSVMIAVSGRFDPVLAAVAVAIVAAVGVAAVGVRRLDPWWTAAFALLGVTPFAVGGEIPDGPEVVVRLVPLAVLIIVLARITATRIGRLPRSLLVDAGNVMLGGGLATWILVVSPMVDGGIASTGTALVAAASIPLSFLGATIAGSLLASGLHRSRTAWAIMALIVGNGLGHLVMGLSMAGVVGAVSADLTRSVLLVVTFLAAALVVWPTATDEAGAETTTISPLPFALRMRATLVLVGSSLPVVLVAAVPIASSTDRVVRTAGTVALVALGAWRTLSTFHASRRAENELLDRADHDDLTRFQNRRRFVATAAQVLDSTWRTEQRPALIQVNLDRFKNINDSLGHDGANEILLTVAQRLRAVGDEIGATIARLSGDEFALLDPGTTHEHALERAEAIRASLAEPVEVDGQQVFVTASIGVVVAPRNRTLAPDEFLRRADIAVHRAKADGRNCIAEFDDSMQATLASRMDIEHALHGVIERNELRLAHQPIVDIVTGEMSGFEALMRWERADGTMVRPDQFIPIAEETGIINDLGAWALLQALTELRRWIDDGTVAPTATMSVNVSPRQIADPGFADVVHEALMRSGVPAHLLWLEVTESMMLSEPDLARATLKQIRAMGVRIALDDFGTGFSSLSLLQGFPLQRIKIDRGFVHGVAENGNDQALVRTIIAMGTSLGMDIVAEGVESVDQLMMLRDLGCPKAQGYLISRPVPGEAMSSTMLALRDLGSMAMFSRPVDVDVLH